MSKYGDGIATSVQADIAYTRERVSGSINIFQNMLKLNFIAFWACNGITGNIETAFTPHSGKGLVYITINYSYWTGTVNSGRTSTNVSGDISIFGSKYDLERVDLFLYTPIYGEVKSLKNLKKLWYCCIDHCNCTGSKTDLWNGGINIRYFSV